MTRGASNLRRAEHIEGEEGATSAEVEHTSAAVVETTAQSEQEVTAKVLAETTAARAETTGVVVETTAGAVETAAVTFALATAAPRSADVVMTLLTQTAGARRNDGCSNGGDNACAQDVSIRGALECHQPLRRSCMAGKHDRALSAPGEVSASLASAS